MYVDGSVVVFVDDSVVVVVDDSFVVFEDDSVVVFVLAPTRTTVFVLEPRKREPENITISRLLIRSILLFNYNCVWYLTHSSLVPRPVRS